MKFFQRRGGVIAVVAVLAIAAVAVGLATTIGGAHAGSTGDQLLPSNKVILQSAKEVNLSKQTVRLPLHRGTFHGKTVWYVITESSDFGLAHDLNINFAPKLANLAIGCAKCVQQVTESVAPNNKFGEGMVAFEGAPDFTPTRVLTPAANGGAPPAVAKPGAVGSADYSPFIRIKGSSVIYNAPIVATGDGPFDVIHHTNTGDRVLAVNPAGTIRPGQFSEPTVDILFVRGFDAGQRIFYISTESSDSAAATLERATFVPLLQKSAFVGADDFLGSGRERIFVFTNGQSGATNDNAQGIDHLIRDGHASQDASAGDTALIDALRNGGDLLNTLGDFPSLADPRHANAYSPLWDAQFGEWSKKAIDGKLNTRQTDENQILNLAATRSDLLTGPGGAPYGSVGFVINCPIIGFQDEEPTNDLVDLVPNAQG